MANNIYRSSKNLDKETYGKDLEKLESSSRFVPGSSPVEMNEGAGLVVLVFVINLASYIVQDSVPRATECSSITFECN